MNIPLDNLYHWIRGLVDEPVSLYTFRTHGSKNINDLHFFGPGSLEYLRSYGFKTFSPWIDESYDLETDTVKRINMMVNEMQRISKLDPEQLSALLKNLKEITQHNKDYFFSNMFFERVQNELTENLNLAVSQVKHTRGQYYLSKIPLIKKYKKPEEPSRLRNIEVAKTLRQLRKNPCTSIRKITSRFPPGFFNP